MLCSHCYGKKRIALFEVRVYVTSVVDFCRCFWKRRWFQSPCLISVLDCHTIQDCSNLLKFLLKRRLRQQIHTCWSFVFLCPWGLHSSIGWRQRSMVWISSIDEAVPMENDAQYWWYAVMTASFTRMLLARVQMTLVFFHQCLRLRFTKHSHAFSFSAMFWNCKSATCGWCAASLIRSAWNSRKKYEDWRCGVFAFFW